MSSTRPPSTAGHASVVETPATVTLASPKFEEKEIVSERVSSVDEEKIIVDWEEGEVANPMNWSQLKRWYITLLSSSLVFNATLASSCPVGIVPTISAQYHMSHTLGVLTISLFVAGFSVGPLLWAPLSEQYGRKPVFIGTFVIYILTQVGNSLSRNAASILVFRMLGGIFAAAPVTNSGGVVGDIWDAGTRGKAMAFFTIAPFAGPAVGPTISGYLTVAHVYWRWLFWILTMSGGLCLALIVFTLPETYKPVLLRQKAKRLNRERNDTRYIAPIDLVQLPVGERIKQVLLKPFVILFSEPMLIAITAYMSFIYGCVYLLIQAYPTVFTRDHHLNPGISGLMLLNLPVGSILAVIAYMQLGNPRYVRAIKKHAPLPVPPELRLEMAVIAAPLFAISFFWFGWTSYPNISFVVPLISGVASGFAICLLFLALFNYVVDAYLPVAASALASMTVVRSLAGAGFPLFATQMYEQLNPRWASTLLGLLAAVMAPIPILLIKYGPRLRKNSKYGPSPAQYPQLSKEAPSAGEDEPSEAAAANDGGSISRLSLASLTSPPVAKLPPV